nr:hypothetical protein CFP56_26961 [Quercus suber]
MLNSTPSDCCPIAEPGAVRFLPSSPSAGKQGGFHSLSPKLRIPHQLEERPTHALYASGTCMWFVAPGFVALVGAWVRRRSSVLLVVARLLARRRLLGSSVTTEATEA